MRAFVAGGLLAGAVLAMAVRPLPGFDTWWHLAAGREMLRTGELLRSETFSFTARGTDWINHAWLWQLGAAAVFGPAADPAGGGEKTVEAADIEERDRAEARGATALVIASGAVLSLGFLLGFAALRSAGTSLAVSSLAVLLCAWAARPRFLARPETATLLLAAAALSMLDLSRRSGRRLPLLALPPLVALGANLHGGSLAIAVIVTAFVASDRIVRVPSLRARLEALGFGGIPPLPVPAPLAIGLVGATVAATGINPFGFRLWTVPLTLSGLVRSEHYYNPEWLPALPHNAPWLTVGVLGLLAVLVLARRRGGIDPPMLFCQLGLAALAFSAVRHVGLFFIALPFALAVPLSRLARGAGGGGKGGGPGIDGGAAALLPAAVIAGLVLSGQVRGGVDRSTTPVDACGFIARHDVAGRLYNDVRFGGYLAWRFAPGRAVFIDGRNELYAPLLRELEGIYSGRAGYEAWRDLVRREEIEGALVRYSESRKGVIYPPREPGGVPRRGYRAYSAYLFPPAEWALVWWDDASMLFLRRGGANSGLIARVAYEAVNPEDVEFLLERAAADTGFAEAVRRDLDRRLREEPASMRAIAIERELQARGR